MLFNLIREINSDTFLQVVAAGQAPEQYFLKDEQTYRLQI